MSDRPAIMLKFGAAGDESTRKRAIQKWVGKDLVDTRQLFPETDDAELSTLFEIYLKDAKRAKSIVKKLEQQDEVEYAHEPADREPR